MSPSRIVSQVPRRYPAPMASAAVLDPAFDASSDSDAPRPELRVPRAALAALGLREDDVILFRVEGDEIVLRAARYIPDPMGIYAEWLGPADTAAYADL